VTRSFGCELISLTGGPWPNSHRMLICRRRGSGPVRGAVRRPADHVAGSVAGAGVGSAVAGVGHDGRRDRVRVGGGIVVMRRSSSPRSWASPNRIPQPVSPADPQTADDLTGCLWCGQPLPARTMSGIRADQMVICAFMTDLARLKPLTWSSRGGHCQGAPSGARCAPAE
jgi:hypothetical protein